MTESDISKLRGLPIESVAGTLGYAVIRHRALCPFHDDHHPSLGFDVRRNRYRCFACGAHGDVIDLVSATLGLGFTGCCMWLSRRDGIIIDDGKKHVSAETPRDDDNRKPDVDYLGKLMTRPELNDDARRFLFDERHIRPEVVAWLGISSITRDCPMGWHPQAGHFDGPALLIPYLDRSGQLQSVQSRYLGSGHKPRFRFPAGSSCHIFGLQVLMFVEKGEPLLITEGVTDCMAAMSARCKAVAIPSATTLRVEDLLPLRGMDLHIFPDRDEPGTRLYLRLCDELGKIGTGLSRHSLPDGFKDLGEWWAATARNDRAHNGAGNSGMIQQIINDKN